MILKESQINIIKKIIKEKKDYIKSRIEDRNFADSWEQSAQISGEIKKESEEIKILEDFLCYKEWSKKLFEIIHNEVRLKTMKYRRTYEW